MLSSILVLTGCLQLSALISDSLQGCGVFFGGGVVAFWVVFFGGGAVAFFSPETFTSFHFLIL